MPTVFSQKKGHVWSMNMSKNIKCSNLHSRICFVYFKFEMYCWILHILNITGISNFLKKIVMINWICCKLLSIEWLYRFVKGARALFVLHLRCLILIKFSIRLLLLFLLKNTHMFRYPNLSTFKTRTSRNSRLFRSSPPEVFW